MAELVGNKSRCANIPLVMPPRRRTASRFSMKSLIQQVAGIILVAGAQLPANDCSAADFTVATPGFAFQINGENGNPTITLQRGKTYTFALNTTPGFHPFAIGTSVLGSAPVGVSGDNNCSSGTITFAVPANAVDCQYYCGLHGSLMVGNIVMVDAPASPPEIRIVGLMVGANLTVTSTLASTNGLTLVPEFTTNLLSTNWFALTVQTNRFANGTNEAICGRPLSDPAFIRIRAQQN